MNTIRLFDGKLAISVPDSFVEMEPEEQKKRFLAAMQPAYSALDSETDTAFTVIRTERDVDETALRERISEYQFGYSRIAPGFIKGQIASKRIRGKLVYALTFQSNGLTKNQFNMIALTAMEGKELLFYWLTPMNEKTGSMLYVFTKAMESLAIEEASSDI